VETLIKLGQGICKDGSLCEVITGTIVVTLGLGTVAHSLFALS